MLPQPLTSLALGDGNVVHTCDLRDKLHLPSMTFPQPSSSCRSGALAEGPDSQDEALPLIHVFSRLKDPKGLATASLVCREWRQAAKTPLLWGTLDLSGQQHTAEVIQRTPASPQYRQHLRSVNLEFTANIKDCHLKALECFRLEKLNLNGCQQLTQQALIQLTAKLPSLQHLELYWNLNVRDPLLLNLATYTRHLTCLSISGCKHVTDEGLRTLAGSCTDLRNLDLTRCLCLTEKGLTFMAARCRELRELRLYACSQVTDGCLNAFGALARLRLLDICGAHLVTDDGLAGLARCRELRSVNLTWCVQLTDRGLCLLAGNSRRLESLSVHGITGVTDATVRALAESCADTLRALDVHGCTGVRQRGRGELLRVLPQLEIFTIHT